LIAAALIVRARWWLASLVMTTMVEEVRRTKIEAKKGAKKGATV
jgi:hypothetical protein